MSHAAVEIDISESDGKAFKSKVRGKTFPVKHWIALLKKLNRNSDIVAERHFRNMLNNRMLKCGISVQCPQCTQHTWYSLDDLSDRVVCERCLEEFEFPGNVRELENMIERAIVIGNGKEIHLKDLPLGKDVINSSVESLDELENKHVLQILNKYSWNISRAAKALNVDRVTLYAKIKKYNLNQPGK